MCWGLKSLVNLSFLNSQDERKGRFGKERETDMQRERRIFKRIYEKVMKYFKYRAVEMLKEVLFSLSFKETVTVRKKWVVRTNSRIYGF